MTGILRDLFESILYEVANLWAVVFTSMGESAFYIEHEISTVLSTTMIDQISHFFILLALSFLVLRILQRGFMTYVLWISGDPDEPISTLLLRIAFSVLVIASFDTLYKIYANISLWIISSVAKLTSPASDPAGMKQIIANIIRSITSTDKDQALITIILLIIYFILLFVLYLQLLKRSAELLLLRLAFPLSAIGILNSDWGAFATTAKLLLQYSLTTIAQLFCMSITVTIFLKTTTITSIFIAYVFCVAAFATPRLLQNILMPVGSGGGGAHKISSVVHTATLVKGLLAS